MMIKLNFLRLKQQVCTFKLRYIFGLIPKHNKVSPSLFLPLFASFSLSLSLKLPEIEIEIETHLSKTRTFQLAS